jgi:hypothetical protein
MLWPLLLAVTMQAAGPVTIVAKDTMSQVDSARTAIAQTQSEWAALWRQHSGETKPPAVDLEARTIVAVFLGSRSSAGYGVDIVSAERANGALIVQYQERRPDPRDITAQVLTSPAVIASVPKFTGPIKFEKVAK